MTAYRAEIDGLRAVAVTAVVLYHGGILPLPGGFAGVDVFFVISGYLIAGLLIEDIAAGRHSLLRFYERRVRRILPALTAMLTVVSLVAALTADPPQLLAYAQSLLASLLMVPNLYFGANSGYFSPALEDAPLLHLWSLGVEEQFYLAFPALLSLICRRAPRRLFAVLAGLALASLALAMLGWRLNPDANYFFPLSRAWELLAGALAADLSRRQVLRPQPALAALGLAMILAAFVLHSDASPYPGLPALLPVTGAALVLVFARAGSGVGRLLASRPFVAIGLISYSTYLWHQPLFAGARLLLANPPGPLTMAGFGLLAYILGAASWAWVEQPFRRRTARWLPDRGRLFAGVAVASLGLALLAGAGLATQGNARAWRAAHPDQAATLDLITAAGEGDGPPAALGPCRFNVTKLDDAARQRIAACAASAGPAVVVLGDSHAIDVWNALAAISPAPFLLGLADGGCRPADADPHCAYPAFAALVRARPQDFAALLYVQAGAYLLDGPDGHPASRQVFRRLGAAQPMPALSPDAATIARTLAYLAPLARAVPVTMLAPRIEPHVPASLVLQHGCNFAYALRPGQEQAFRRLDKALQDALAGTAIAYLPLAAQPLDMAQDFMTCSTLYWSDGDHWSRSGEARFGARLLPLLPAAFR
jgi:peptidoglycan/LPS O-acetylase OafA/YrhL